MTDYTQFVLETDRLRLIANCPQYREQIFKQFTAEVAKYMYPRPSKTIDETDAFIASARKGMEAKKEVQIIILDKVTGEFLGCGGLHHLDTQYPELGIWTKMSSHGNHYGREAMMALARWGFANFDLHGIKYPADYRNVASRKIAESMGGVLVKRYDIPTRQGTTLNIVEYFIDGFRFDLRRS